MEKIGPQLKEQMEKAKLEIEKAKVEIREYRKFIDGLVDDKLIDKDNYTIEHKNAELFINGKKQSEEVYKKYNWFLQKHPNLYIHKTPDNLEMNNNRSLLATGAMKNKNVPLNAETF
ncbi:MAG: hypothetical protein C4308_12900 [Chitinophagaceae bacterium]